MEDHQQDALLERSPSADIIMAPRRNANAKAFKVAGLTVLACLLLAGQAITAYFVLGQRDHLHSLEQGQENLKKELTRRVSVSPKMMHMPMNSMPLLKTLDMDDESPKTPEKKRLPLTRLQSSSFMREGSGIPEGSRMSKAMRMPMKSLPMQMVPFEEKPQEDATEAPAVEVETKCKLEAEREVQPGRFKPMCDEEGNYLPMQCWHSTGYCWCVDKNGKEIEGTAIRGRPHCGDVNAN